MHQSRGRYLEGKGLYFLDPGQVTVLSPAGREAGRPACAGKKHTVTREVHGLMPDKGSHHRQGKQLTSSYNKVRLHAQGGGRRAMSGRV